MSVQSRVNTAIDAVKRGQQARADYEAEIAKLRPMLPKQREAGRAMLLECIGRKYEVAVVDGQGKAAGTMVLDSEAEGYEAAKTALRRMVDDIYGKNPSGSSKADPVEKLLSAYAELTAAQKRKFKASI
jgi:hypothetical protein